MPRAYTGGQSNLDATHRRLAVSPCAVTFADVLVKQLVQDWGDDKNFDADEKISLHMEERFGAKSIHVAAASEEEEQLLLRITTDQWAEPREFALLSNGSLAW